MNAGAALHARGRLSTPGSPRLLFLLLGLVGCADPPPPPVDLDASLRAELGISAGVPIHRFTLGGRGADDRVVPSLVEAAPGDVIHFLSADRRVQTVTFGGEGLGAEAEAFLRRTGQLASPPLVDAGSRFVLSLEGAPLGRYPFRVEGHGDPVGGVVVVGRR